MKRFALYLVMVCLMQQSASAQEATEHKGSLNAEIKAGGGMSGYRYKPASAEDKAKLPSPLAEGDKAFSEELNWQRKKDAGHFSVLVEPASGDPFIYVDMNQDGKLTSSERFSFSPVTSPPGGSELLLKFPLENNPFKYYPVKIRLSKVVAEFQKATSPKSDNKMVLASFEAYVEGSVHINGRKTIVRYNVNPQTGVVDPKQGYQGIDGDGDGKVDTGMVSPEWAFARKETVVFRVGDRYVSTKSIDANNLTLILKEHPASDYQRIELRLGAELPDFTFTDFNGKQRKLSEFRGKHLLLEFWGTWCGPCVAEIPNLKGAYEKYSSRGFEILGMDQDKDMDKVKAFLAEKGVIWPQATTPSIEDLLEKRFRIVAYPTTVLLDPQGKIISLGMKDQMPLRGRELLNTLEKVLPAAQ